MKKSIQDHIDNHLDALNTAKEKLNTAKEKINHRLKRLTQADTPIYNIFKQSHDEQLDQVRENLKGI